MERKPSAVDRIRNEISDIRRRSVDESLRSMGHDVAALRAIESRAVQRLSEQVDALSSAPREQEDQQAASALARATREGEQRLRLIERLRDREPGDGREALRELTLPGAARTQELSCECSCIPIEQLTSSSDGTLDVTSLGGADATAESEFIDFAFDRVGRTRLKVTATSNAGSAESWLTEHFTFLPDEEGCYCFDPSVLVKGLWSFALHELIPGSGIGNGNPQVNMELEATVEQNGSEINSLTRPVFPLLVAPFPILGLDGSWVINWSTWNNHSMRLVACLDAKEETTISVTLKSKIELSGSGTARLDLWENKRYFFVPRVDVGRVECDVS